MKAKVLGLLAVGLLAGPMAAGATMLRLDATSNLPLTVSSFWVDFQDTGDGLLQLAEVTGFSGINFYSPPFNGVTLVAVGASPFSTASFASGCISSGWCFADAGGSRGSGSAGIWSYSLSTRSVPEPGTLAMLGLGLAGLGVSRRRKAA